jgi:hypothetical protein
MGWTTTLDWKQTEFQKIPRKQYRQTVFGVARLYKCTRTITTSEAEGLTQAKADSTAAALADTKTTCKSLRMNDAAGYKVVKTVDSQTAWTLVSET